MVLKTVSNLAKSIPDVQGIGETGKQAAGSPQDEPDTYPGLPVQPHVAKVANYLSKLFSITSITTYPGHEPSEDLAIDIFSDSGTMSEIADFVAGNIDSLSVDYLIYAQRFFMGSDNKYGPARTWSDMEDRGSATQNHFDHVHVSFLASGVLGSTSGSPVPSGTAPKSGLSSLQDFLSGGGLARALAQGIANGVFTLYRYLYATMILKPLDSSGGFSYELYRVLKSKFKPWKPGDPVQVGVKKIQLPRLWLALAASLTYVLAYGKNEEGSGYIEDSLQQLQNMLQLDSKRNIKQPSHVATVARIKGVGVVGHKRGSRTIRKTEAGAKAGGGAEAAGRQVGSGKMGSKQVNIASREVSISNISNRNKNS